MITWTNFCYFSPLFFEIWWTFWGNQENIKILRACLAHWLWKTGLSCYKPSDFEIFYVSSYSLSRFWLCRIGRVAVDAGLAGDNAIMGLFWPCFQCGLVLSGLWGSLWAVSKVESSPRARLVSPSEVYPTGKLQWHFTCGFDFRHHIVSYDCHL